MTLDVVQFVDSISASPSVRLNLNNESPWAVAGIDLSPPRLKAAYASTLLVDGERLTAAAYANRTLTLTLELIGTQDASATALQALWRELDRPTNLLRYQPDGATSPVFFRTLRSMDNSVRDYPGGGGTALRTLQVEIEAEPFALGLKESLSAVTVYNDPAEGGTLNANPYFETNAASWTPTGATFVRSTAQFHEGAASGLLTPDGVTAASELYSDLVPGTAGASVRVSSWVRCAAARSVQIFAVWFDSGGGFLSSSSNTVAVAATTWTLLEHTATAPVGAAQCRLGVVMPGTPPASATLHIDEARLRQVGGVGGMCFDVTSPKGDVEAPLFLSVRASDVARVPESPVTGRRQSVFAVRRGGTPSAAPVVLQMESMSAGTDTAVQPASESSGTFLRVSFATATSLQQRATTVGQFPSAVGVDVRGTYRVFVRCRKSVAGDSMQLQMRYANAAASVTSELVAGPADAVWRWVDMGLVQMPLGYDPATDGLSGVSLPVGGMGVRVDAARTSGSGTLDLDVVMFLPADDRMCLVKWPDYTTETSYVVDPVAGQAYGVGSSGEVRASLLELIGGAPMVTPAVANRIWMLRDVGSTWSAGDDVAASVQVTPYYWPRYLHTRGAS